MTAESDVDRRTWLKVVGGTITGLVIGGIIGYVSKAPEVIERTKTVATTLTKTVTVEISPSPTVTPAKPVSLYFLSSESDPNSVETYKAIFKEYTKLNPNVTITDEYVGWGDIMSRQAALVAAGTPPDFTRTDDDFGLEAAREGWMAGETMTELVDELGLPESSRRIYKGEDYIVPGNLNVSELWYRADILEKHKVDPPKTWEECIDVASEIDTPEIRGFMVPSAAKYGAAFYALNWFWTNGVRFMDYKDGKFYISLDETPNRSRAVETLEFLKELHKYSPPASDWSWGEFLDAYATEKVAIGYYVGARLLNVVIERNPKLEDVTKPIRIPPKVEKVNAGGVEGHQILKTDNVNWTKDLLRFVHTGDRIIKLLHMVPLHDLPADPKILDDPVYQDNPIIQRHIDTIPLWKELILESRSSGNRLGIPNPYFVPVVFSEYKPGQMVYRVNIADEDPDTVVDTTAEKMRETLEELLKE